MAICVTLNRGQGARSLSENSNEELGNRETVIDAIVALQNSLPILIIDCFQSVAVVLLCYASFSCVEVKVHQYTFFFLIWSMIKTNSSLFSKVSLQAQQNQRSS